ncbi:hypothetical protein DRP77_03415, partial [Candidatus Poribacteria bacterium]
GEPKGRRLWAALISVFAPGVGQRLLRRGGRGILILLAFGAGVLISYVNFTVKGEMTVYAFSEGKRLMFKPVKALIFTGAAQALAAWVYGVIDALRGRR